MASWISETWWLTGLVAVILIAVWLHRRDRKQPVDPTWDDADNHW